MRKPKGSPPSYCLHKPSGLAYVATVHEGKRVQIYLGPYGSPESLHRYQQLLAAGGRLTIGEMCGRFLDWSATYYRSTDGGITREPENYRHALRLLIELYGTNPAAMFDRYMLADVREKMITTVCRRTTNARVQKIKRVFRWAANEGLIPDDVALGLQLLENLRPYRSAARESTPVPPVNPDSVIAVLSRLNRVVRAMVEVQYHTGMRPGEICSLTPGMITTGPVWVADFRHHKSAHHGIPRRVYIGPKGQAILRRWIQSDEPHLPIFRPYYVSRRGGMQYDHRSYNHAIRRACQRAHIEVWHPNQIRHAFATTVRKIFGLDGAQVMLGHRQADTTEIYAEVDATLAEKIARRLG